MIVVDASAAVDLVLNTRLAAFVAATALTDEADLHAPALIDVEVAGALRKRELRGQLTRDRAESALGFFGDLRLMTHELRPLLARAWALRANVTIADGVYLALAELTGGRLLTTDLSLARAAARLTQLRVLTPEPGEGRVP